MTNIVEFKRREPEEPEEEQCQGAALCVDCKHEWHAIVPSVYVEESDGWLECPSCHLVRGRFKYRFNIGEDKWRCGCGNSLFEITSKFTYCPNCGREQLFPGH